MGEVFWKNLCNWGTRVKRSKKEKKNIIVLISILIFSVGVFFCPDTTKTSMADGIKPKSEITLPEMVPNKNLGTFAFKDSGEKKKPAIKTTKSCILSKFTVEKSPNAKLGEKELAVMVAGHPIEEMASYISKRDKRVASFLVAIAKKESDWGKHSPLKFGQNCYNYWGYRGTYNQTESGYSCFDNPEQAIRVVGDKIESLLAQQVNTAERMIVWKCGRNCAGHDPAGVAKWISDVALYYVKMNS